MEGYCAGAGHSLTGSLGSRALLPRCCVDVNQYYARKNSGSMAGRSVPSWAVWHFCSNFWDSCGAAVAPTVCGHSIAYCGLVFTRQQAFFCCQPISRPWCQPGGRRLPDNVCRVSQRLHFVRAPTGQVRLCGVHWRNGLQQVALLGVTCSRCGLQHCVRRSSWK